MFAIGQAETIVNVTRADAVDGQDLRELVVAIYLGRFGYLLLDVLDHFLTSRHTIGPSMRDRNRDKY